MPKVRFILLQLLLVFVWMVFSPSIETFSSLAEDGNKDRQKKEFKADTQEEQDTEEEGKEEQEKESLKEWYCSSENENHIGRIAYYFTISFYHHLNHIFPNGYSGIHTPPPKH